MDKVEIQINLSGIWEDCGEVQLKRRAEEPGRFIYYDDFFFDHSYPIAKGAIVSQLVPLQLDSHDRPHWPAFAVDLVPGGWGRRQLIRQHGIADDDISLLQCGAHNPPGNLRVRPQFEVSPMACDLDKLTKDYKVEWERLHQQHTQQVGGGTDLQGDAPKFMLQHTLNGNWLIDNGHLNDADSFYILKFARSPQPNDQLILELEYKYMHVAAELGMNVSKLEDYRICNAGLMIPRFDREASLRFGMESLYSVNDSIGRGQQLCQFDNCRRIYDLTDTPEKNLHEYIRRDVLNEAFGNTDNHGRNTAFLRKNGGCELSPIYDFAPMIMDKQLIIRTSNWSACEDGRGIRWPQVFERLEELFPTVDFDEDKDFCRDMPARAEQLSLEYEFPPVLSEKLETIWRRQEQQWKSKGISHE